jgi:hypothetical protein
VSTNASNVVAERQLPPVVSDRFVEKMQILVERINPLVYLYKSNELFDIHHELWMMTRVLKRDPDLSQEDVALLLP